MVCPDWSLVPIYDGRKHLKDFKDLSFEALAPLPRWPQGEVPTGCVVTIGHTIQKYLTNKGEDGNLSLNVQYVLVLYCPESIGSPATSPPASPSKFSSAKGKGKAKAVEEETVDESEEEAQDLEDEDIGNDESGSDEL